jgi:hypothetical protein
MKATYGEMACGEGRAILRSITDSMELKKEIKV